MWCAHRACILAESDVNDQASGLRRLFGARLSQVVAFAAGEANAGRTPLVVRTARTLAEAGEAVILVDENAGPKSALSRLGAQTDADLWDVLDGRTTLAQRLQPLASNLWGVAAAGVAARVHRDHPATRERLGQVLGPLRAVADFVLVDSHLRAQAGLSMLSSTADNVVLVVTAESASITEAYALIKRLAQERERRDFRLVITRPSSEAVARTVFDNLARTAKTHLGVTIDLLATVIEPNVDDIAEALLCRLPLPPQAPQQVPLATL